MFNFTLRKRIKRLERVAHDLAEHCGTWVELAEDGEVGEGMHFGNGSVQICDVVRAVVNHLGLDIGVKAVIKKSTRAKKTLKE